MNNKPSPTGHFLVIEGPDGVGKTTQLELLRRHLQERGAEVVVVREPGGTAVGEGIRDLFKANFGQADPMTEVLLMLAARNQLTQEVIRPALQRNAWVISDRHTPSTFAYQGGGHRLGFSSILRAREGLEHHDYKAHATVILRLDEQERQRRLAARGLEDKIDQAGQEFAARVVKAYDEMVDGNWSLSMGILKGVNANGTAEEVHARILDAFFWELNCLNDE